MTGPGERLELIATYVADLPDEGTQEAAEAFATGQSIGTWLPVPGITDEMRRRHGARVLEVVKDPDRRPGGESTGNRWLLRVAFAAENFGPQFPMMLTTLVGNDPSTSQSVRLLDVELDDGYQRQFPGPRHGIAGWRAITGVHDRPLLLNMIKPCTGYSPAVGANLLELPARGGADLIKDDELLADAPFNRVAERPRLYRERLERVAAETGHRARYICNVSDRATRILDTARAAVDGGADALMVNALVVGLDSLQSLAEADLGVPILIHTAAAEVFTGGGASGIGQAVLFGKLLRLAGADSIFTTTPFARRPPPRAVYDLGVEWMREPRGHLLPTMPMVAGGVHEGMIRPLIEHAGMDIILGVGGAIQGHPQGAEAGAQAFRAAIQRTVADLRASGAAAGGTEQVRR
jgi:2,3-diketo-5-methylthiopentyl-1-phosphate enolase